MIEDQNVQEHVEQVEELDEKKSSFTDELLSQGLEKLVIESGKQIVDMSKDIISSIVDHLDI